MKKKIQITLSDHNEREKALIEHLDKYGKWSGIAKIMLLNGYENENVTELKSIEKKDNKMDFGLNIKPV